MTQHKTIIAQELAMHGWLPVDDITLASKLFDTAAGAKEAFVYLDASAPEDPNNLLHGQYWSEGRNILESHCVLIPKGADAATVRELAATFVRRAEDAVGCSYAVRLLRSTPAAADSRETDCA